MKLNNLTPKSKNQVRKRVGRGISAGGGKTAGRGTKGQKARTGFNLPIRFEGGQSPLIQRLPKKRGIKARTKNLIIIKTSKISKNFSEKETVSAKTLQEKGLIKKLDANQKIKVLFDKAINKKIKLKGLLTSKTAKKYFSIEN